MTTRLEAELADNAERKYEYSFDDTLRRYLLRTFLTFGASGKALELGCYLGGFTSHLIPHFPDLTIVDGATSALETARRRHGETLQYREGMLETIELPEKTFEAVFLVHVLEHVDDPVRVLTRISTWLTPTGKLYLAVPNALAASRQLATRMGIIDHNTSVTPGERAQGHRRTYTMDRLQRDAKNANLTIEASGGVFFKPLANFQFDKLLNTDIINSDYLEACYSLGMDYPELTASIYAICKRTL